jgi:hypothetical protein
MSAPTFVAILYAGLEDYGTLMIEFDNGRYPTMSGRLIPIRVILYCRGWKRDNRLARPVVFRNIRIISFVTCSLFGPNLADSAYFPATLRPKISTEKRLP